MTRRMIYFLLLILCFGIRLSGDEGWKHEFTRNNVQVYTRQAPGFPYPEFLGVTVIDAPLELVRRVTADADSFKEWMHECGDSRLLEVKGKDHWIGWLTTEAPFPVSDRDVVIESTSVARGNQVIDTVHAVEHSAKPPCKKYVRMARLDSIWTYTAIGNTTEVRYQAKTDPSGSIPDWLVSMKLKDTPLGTLRNLHRQVKKDKYRQG